VTVDFDAAEPISSSTLSLNSLTPVSIRLCRVWGVRATSVVGAVEKENSQPVCRC